MKYVSKPNVLLVLTIKVSIFIIIIFFYFYFLEFEGTCPDLSIKLKRPTYSVYSI